MPLTTRAAMAALIALTTAGSGLAAPTCSVGRYVVRGRALFRPAARKASAKTPDETVILLAGDRISIANECAPTEMILRQTRRGTTVKALWPSCTTLKGPVRLSGMVGGEGCRTLRGSVRSRRDGVQRRFRAAFSLVESGSCADESTFAHIERRIFGPRGCRAETCHGSAAGAGGLDLRTGRSYDSLVGIAAANAAAAADGKLRVAPGDPDASFLLDKLSGELTAAEGAQMPDVGRALNAGELDLVRAWIAAGAPATGRVAGASCLPPDTFVAAPALDLPPGGHQIVFEGPTLQPGEEIEGCMWVRAPNTADFAVGAWEYSISPGTHHFAVWAHDHGPEPELNVFKRDTACFSGGARVDGVSLSGAPESPYYVESYPSGVGTVLPAGALIGINPHYRNEFDVPVTVRAWINLRPVDGPLEHVAEGLVSTFATLGDKSAYSIFAAPFSTGKLRVRYHPPAGPQTIFRLAGHQHQRGTHFTAWRSDGTKLYENFDWSHPAKLDLDPPLVLQPDDYIEYECEQDNGITRPVRRCGDSAADKNCTPGDPIPVTFGLTAADEMCLLVGLSY